VAKPVEAARHVILLDKVEVWGSGIVAGTAKIEPLPIPQDCAEAGYRPSMALAEFVRFRDLTCWFPGREKPAEACNIGHGMPFPVGPSHPSNLKRLCCYQHRRKQLKGKPRSWPRKGSSRFACRYSGWLRTVSRWTPAHRRGARGGAERPS
jgi:hypothetical protein